MPPSTTKSALKPAHQLLDMDFLENRAKLIDIAAFLDRLDRASDGPEASKQDFRAVEFTRALAILLETAPGRAARVLDALSDPSTTPIEKAPEKGAHGAWHRPGDGGTA